MKVPVPREEIEQIMADYKCTEKDAAKAYLDAREKANEAFKDSLSEKLEHRESTSEQAAPKVYNPKEIKSHLDKYIIGQEEYKKRLAISAAYHFAMIKLR